MSSGVDMFYAELDERMSRPSGSFANYLARLQHSSETGGSYSFNPRMISEDNINATTLLQQPGHSGDQQVLPTSSGTPPPADIMGNSDDAMRGDGGSKLNYHVSVHHPPKSHIHCSSTGSKRKPDPSSADLNQRPGQKARGAGEGEASLNVCPALAHPHDHEATHPTTLPDSVSVGLNSPVVVDEGRSSPPAALAASEAELRCRNGASRGATQTCVRAHSSSAPADKEKSSEHTQLPRTVTGSKAGSGPRASNVVGPSGPHLLQTSNGNQRHDANKSSPRKTLHDGAARRDARRHDRNIADSSNITTPPNTAPGAPAFSAVKKQTKKQNGVAEKGRTAKQIPAAERGATAAGMGVRAGAGTGGGGDKRPAHGKRKKKELVTPLEYARRLQAQFAQAEEAGGKEGRREHRFLKGNRIFYYGGDLNYAGQETRGRMDIIARWGGTLVPKYDPDEVTHIVTEASAGTLLRAIGLKKLSDIPQHIPTVKWGWVVRGIDQANRRAARQSKGKGTGRAPQSASVQDDAHIPDDDEREYEKVWDSDYAAFPERIDAGRTPWAEVAKLRSAYAQRKNVLASKTKATAGGSSTEVDGDWQTRATRPVPTSTGIQNVDDISNISDFTQDKACASDTRGGAQITPNLKLLQAYAGLPSPPSSPNLPAPTLCSEDVNNQDLMRCLEWERPGHGVPRSGPSSSVSRSASREVNANGNAEAGLSSYRTLPQSGDGDGNGHGHGQEDGGSRATENDPLAEFYAQARAERDAEMFDDDESDSESILSEKMKGEHSHPDKHQSQRLHQNEHLPQGSRQHRGREVVKKGVFLCDDKGGQRRLEACPNQDVIDKLEELKSLHDAKPTEDDKWRVYGLNKAIAALRKHPTRIQTVDEAQKLRGVGAKTAQKIMEIIQTGELRRIQYETTDDIKAVMLFTGIYGVGGKIARMWYNNGCRTLEDVAARKGGIHLSHAQEIGLKYYHDINTRIPRTEVQEIYDKVKTEALRIDPELFIEVMGSFRRGKSTCGDIDVLISRPTHDGKTHQGVLRHLLAELHRQGVIMEDLCLPEDFEDLELFYRGLCRKDSQSLRRRIDFLTVPWHSRGAALLYYTGDDIFNRSLRLKANRMGYSLNQRGLYGDVVRDNHRQKVTEGQLVASESEREILDILGVPWQEPHERIRS